MNKVTLQNELDHARDELDCAETHTFVLLKLIRRVAPQIVNMVAAYVNGTDTDDQRRELIALGLAFVPTTAGIEESTWSAERTPLLTCVGVMFKDVFTDYAPGRGDCCSAVVDVNAGIR